MRWCWRNWAACVLVGLSAAALRADEEFDRLLADFNAAQKEWREAAKAAGQLAEGEGPIVDFRPKMQAFAERNAGKPEAFPALLWIVETGPAAKVSAAGAFAPEPTVRWAVERLTAAHAADPGWQERIRRFRYAVEQAGPQALRALYTRIAKDHADAEVRAFAEFNLAFTDYYVRRLTANAAPGKAVHDARGAAARPSNAAAPTTLADQFRRVSTEHPDTEAARSAAAFVFELERLQVGMPAPEITGESPDSRTLRLSDYRGNVVLLDFWGLW